MKAEQLGAWQALLQEEFEKRVKEAVQNDS